MIKKYIDIAIVDVWASVSKCLFWIEETGGVSIANTQRAYERFCYGHHLNGFSELSKLYATKGVALKTYRTVNLHNLKFVNRLVLLFPSLKMIQKVYEAIRCMEDDSNHTIELFVLVDNPEFANALHEGFGYEFFVSLY